MCLFIIWAAPAWAQTAKRILALHSYHQSYVWEQGLDQAINHALAQATFPVQVFHEYMDSLRLPDPRLQTALTNYLRARYVDAHLDLILASDNEALVFLLNNRDRIFGPIPVVFTGINGYNPTMIKGRKGYTGVAEQVDIFSTLKVALDLRPQTRRVVVFGRLSMTYSEDIKLLRQAVVKLGGGLEVVERPGLTIDRVLKEVAELGESDMVLLTEPVPDEQGRLVVFSCSTPLITQASKAPVYSLWDVVLGKGIVGGKLVSAAEQGRVAAEMALKILAGRNPASLPVVTKSPNRYMFDYKQLLRFHLPLSALPQGSIVINRPESLWAKHKAAILGLAGLLLLMSLTIGALTYAVFTRRRSNAALRKSEERFRTVVDQAADAFFIVDAEGRICDVNQAACRSLKYTRGQLLGLPVSAVDSRVAQDWPLKVIWEKLATGRTFQFESEHRCQDGTSFPVEVSLGQLEVAGQKLMLGLARDISERKQHEWERLEQLRFMECLDRINQAIQGANDLDQMMSEVLDQVLAIFDCDRAWLLYPCDPEAAVWWVPMERTKPEYPGAKAMGQKMPINEEVAGTFSDVLAAGGPVRYDPQSSHAVLPEIKERHGVKSYIAMAIYPKTGKPWEFGMHQCSHARVWTPEEERLFQEIGWRLSNALDTLLIHRRLQQGEERYRTLVNNLPDLVVRYDRDLCRTYVNPSWEKASGLSAAQVIGLPVSDRSTLPKPLAEKHQEKIRETLETGVTQTIEFTATDARGEELFLQYTLVPEFDSQEQVAGVLAVGHDLTQRKRSEAALHRLNEELRQSEKRKTILNHIANVFLTVPDEDMYGEVLDIILRVMKSEFGIFGYLDEKGDLIIPSLTRDVWGECQIIEKSVIFPAGTWGESLWGQAIRQKKALHDDAPFNTPEGHIAINSFLAVPVKFRDRVIGLLCVANKKPSYTERDKELLEGITDNIAPILNARLQRDAHERKRMEAERALIESGERITALFNASTDSIILQDTQGNILAINEQGAQRRGLHAEELNGKTIHDILPQAIATAREAKIGEVVKSAQPAVLEEEWGGNFYLVSLFPVLDNRGAVRQIACFSRDVTEIKRGEEEKSELETQLRQAQKMQALGTLAGGIAHDFNNILTAIMGFSEMALDDAKQGSPAPHNLEHVLEATERAKNLVHQILTFSRKVEHDLQPLNLNKVVMQAVQLLQQTIPKMIRLETEMADEIQAINADPNQLEQVILNLGVNAADAMPEGGELRITTKSLRVEKQTCLACGKFFSGRYVKLEVSDSGHGMDEQTQERIFEPFYTTKEIGKGTGLGLSTVFGMVLAHNGHIVCHSQPGAGTTFSLYFPTIEEQWESLPADQQLTARFPGGHERILLVDDEAAIREIGDWVLKTAGYQVHTASSGETAIEAYRDEENDFDLIIMDLGMPGMGGYKALKAIRGINPRAKVLVASGYAENEQMKDVLKLDAVGYVAKPFKKAELLAKVRSVLDKN